jgi:hypothetical protein
MKNMVRGADESYGATSQVRGTSAGPHAYRPIKRRHAGRSVRTHLLRRSSVSTDFSNTGWRSALSISPVEFMRTFAEKDLRHPGRAGGPDAVASPIFLLIAKVKKGAKLEQLTSAVSALPSAVVRTTILRRAASVRVRPSMHIVLAAEIGLQLADREALLINDALDQIADRDDAHHGFVLNDR